jgi:hypothetical protein
VKPFSRSSRPARPVQPSPPPADNGTVENAAQSSAPQPERPVTPEPESVPEVGAPEPVPERPADVFRGPLESALRHPILVLLPLLLAVGAAVAVGLQRDPVYTAEARINVGRVDVPAYTLQGVTIGNSTLAASYARAIVAPDVITAAARKAQIPLQAAATGLSASPIPKSTLIGVDADTSTEGASVALANAGAAELIDYVTKLNLSQQSDLSLKRFRAASARAQRALIRVQSLTAQGAVQRKALRQRLVKARTRLATAQVATGAIQAEMVRNAQAPDSKGLLQLIVPATRATSDRDDVLGEITIIGAVSGLVIGLALALLRANWGYLRRSRA